MGKTAELSKPLRRHVLSHGVMIVVTIHPGSDEKSARVEVRMPRRRKPHWWAAMDGKNKKLEQIEAFPELPPIPEPTPPAPPEVVPDEQQQAGSS